MQLIVAGTLDDGRSGVIRRENLSEETRSLWTMAEESLSVGGVGSSAKHDIGVGSGETRFMLVDVAAPTTKKDMHHVNAISFAVVLSGSTDYLLEAERVRMNPGDCLVSLDPVHGWEPLTESVILAATIIGLKVG